MHYETSSSINFLTSIPKSHHSTKGRLQRRKSIMLSELVKFSLLFMFLMSITVATKIGAPEMYSSITPTEDSSGTPASGSGSGHGANWDYSWGWGSSPGSGWGYGSGSARSPTGFGRGYGYGSGTGSGSGSGFGYGTGSGGAHGGGSANSGGGRGSGGHVSGATLLSRGRNNHG